MQVDVPKLDSFGTLMIYFGVARLIPDGIGSYGSLALRGLTGRGTECAPTRINLGCLIPRAARSYKSFSALAYWRYSMRLIRALFK